MTGATLSLAPSPAEAAPYKASLRTAISKLPVASERSTGYDRDDFKLWIDADSDSCDTREEVLIAEAKTKPRVGSGCSLSGGKWYSYYDGVSTTNPSSFDIDHMVPLAEAWGSGAYKWNEDTRTRYANDLGDGRALVAVTANSNRSKSDRDPAEWLPKKDVCRYLSEWVAVKIRWSLTVDTKEKARLVKLGAGCSNVTLTVTKAKVVTGGTSNPSGSDTGLRVASIAYDPAGTDTVGAEYVTLKNSLSTPITLGGWQIADSAGTTYTFPNVSLAPGASVRLVTGPGTSTSTTLYAGKGSSWWNNSGDSFYLYNPSAQLKQTGSYNGAGDGAVATF